MVLAKVNKRKAINSKKKSHKFWLTIPLVLLLGVIVAGATIGVLYLLSNNQEAEVEVSDEPEQSIEPIEEPPEVVLPAKIDYQPIIDDWVKNIGGNKSVLIYDIERDEIVGKYNPDESYGTASLYKLFVVYEGYRRVQSGAWQADAIAGSTGKTIVDCLDLSIRESYSPCAETLWTMIGHAELDSIIKNDFKITNSDISHLVSNPNDISAIMKLFYTHEPITDQALVARMKDSFLVQPKTTYDWRQGLPSGFKSANVYNKVGWDYNPNGGYWNIYHDTAIVEFPEQNRHYIVTVMTNRVLFQQISQLGTRFENYFYDQYKND